MDVKVYSTPTCPWCVRVKEFLNENKIQFEDIDVATHQDKAQEMMQKSGQSGVPVVEIDGQVVVGFDEGRLRKILKLE